MGIKSVFIKIIWILEGCILLVSSSSSEQKSENSDSNSKELSQLVPGSDEYLIHEAVKWFPNQLKNEGFDTFIQKTKRRKTTYASVHKGFKSHFPSHLGKRGEVFIILEKGKDGLLKSEVNTHIVLLKSFPDNPKSNEYTAHKAYLRKIKERKIIEWDLLTPSYKIQGLQSFLTTFIPIGHFIKNKAHIKTNSREDFEDLNSYEQSKKDIWLKHLSNPRTPAPESPSIEENISKRTQNSQTHKQSKPIVQKADNLSDEKESEVDKTSESKEEIIEGNTEYGGGSEKIKISQKYLEDLKNSCSKIGKFPAELKDPCKCDYYECKKLSGSSETKGKKFKILTYLCVEGHKYNAEEKACVFKKSKMKKNSTHIFMDEGLSLETSKEENHDGLKKRKDSIELENRESKSSKEHNNDGLKKRKDSIELENRESKSSKEHNNDSLKIHEVSIELESESSEEDLKAKLANFFSEPFGDKFTQELSSNKNKEESTNPEKEVQVIEKTLRLTKTTETSNSTASKDHLSESFTSHQIQNPQEESDSKNNYELKLTETKLTMKGNNNGKIQSLQNPNQKYFCPKYSRSFLLGNRCYCPKGRIIKNNVCTRKEEDNESVLIMYGPMEAPFDILENNYLRKRKTSNDEGNESDEDNKESQELTSMSAEVEDAPKNSAYKKKGFQKRKDLKKFSQMKGYEFVRAMEYFTIGNDKQTGHPLFHSKVHPYTGILECTYEEKTRKEFQSSSPLKNLVDFYLHTLRAQCHNTIRNHVLSLFSKEIVHLSHKKKDKKHVIEMNLDSKLLNMKILNPVQWTDFLSAIFLSKYSEAFVEQEEKQEKRKAKKMEEDEISPSIKTLQILVEKTLDLLKKEQFERHAVKISFALDLIIQGWTQRVQKQGVILELFCANCNLEKEVNSNDLYFLEELSNFL